MTSYPELADPPAHFAVEGVCCQVFGEAIALRSAGDFDTAPFQAALASAGRRLRSRRGVGTMDGTVEIDDTAADLSDQLDGLDVVDLLAIYAVVPRDCIIDERAPALVGEELGLARLEDGAFGTRALPRVGPGLEAEEEDAGSGAGVADGFGPTLDEIRPRTMFRVAVDAIMQMTAHLRGRSDSEAVYGQSKPLLSPGYVRL
jgi:hypothetical protein